MNETLQTAITVILYLLSSTGIIGIIVKFILDYRFKIKYNRVSFYDSKYFTAYNETWSAFCKSRASTNSLFRYQKNTMKAAEDVYNNHSKNYNDFLDTLLRNSLFLTDDIYELFSEAITKVHELGDLFENSIIYFKKEEAEEYVIPNEVMNTFYVEYEKIRKLSDNIRIIIKHELENYQK